jgi:hypothetical protein
MVPRIVRRILSRATFAKKGARRFFVFSNTICAVNDTAQRCWILAAVLVLLSCSGLSTLTPAMLDEAEAKWNDRKPSSYRMVVSMEGDRVERGEFDVRVETGAVTELRRNGAAVNVKSGQDYSMDGLFKMIREEMDLAKNPSLFGAPAGYSAYLMARFDGRTGGLVQYRRSVGGISNSIDIQVLSFEAKPAPGK